MALAVEQNQAHPEEVGHDCAVTHDLGMQLAPVNPVRTAWMASSRANTGRKLFCLVLSFSGRHEQNLVKVEHVVANR